MKGEDLPYLEKFSWKEIRSAVNKVNPELTNIIDEINPEFPIYKASYIYGDEIVKNGELYLPSKKLHYLIPLKSQAVSNKIREDIGYNSGSNPASLLLKNGLELFINLPDRIIPYSIIQPGKIFGLWHVLDKGISYYPESFLWGMTAGARSIFMLPKISEAIANTRLRSMFHLSEDKPKKLIDQWKIFRELAINSQPVNPWDVEILFFSKHWFNNIDKRWSRFNYYILNTAWQSSSYWRNQYIWNLIFSSIHQKRGIKPAPYITDIVRHILLVGIGVLPGFAPAINSDLAPIKQLQEIYVKHYGLKKYMPVILQPSYFNLKDNGPPVYISLQYCTAMELGMKSYDRATTLTNLYHVGGLLTKYIEEILKNNELNVGETPLKELAEKGQFDLFHSNPAYYRQIKDTKYLALEDHNYICQPYSKKIFPKNNTFINGCVKISRKKF